MAVTRLSSAFACVFFGAMTCAGAATSPDNNERDFTWSADVLSSDFRSDTLQLSGNVRVRQGPLSIEAHAATATDFQADASRWRFEDSVYIRSEQADLQSQSAEASIVDGQIVKARVEGSPAEFHQRGQTEDRQVQGRAGVIEYDFGAGVVRLSDQVWFSNGKDEFRGDVVIYDVRDERVQINPAGAGAGRVRGVIRPREREIDASGETPTPEPATPSSDENDA
jgi:lipopolysaccharide transport protein LptA